MPDFVRFPLVLTIVGLVSAISLGYLNGVTKKVRVEMEKKEKEESLHVVLPDAESFEEKVANIDGEEFRYYTGLRGGEVVGYAGVGSAFGYSSEIVVMVGVKKDFTVNAINVISQKETPGLGDKVCEVLSKKTIGGLILGKEYHEEGLRPWFQEAFSGKKAPFMVSKDAGSTDVNSGATQGKASLIDAITGATISSRAVCKAVNSAVDKIYKATSLSSGGK